MDKHLNLFYSYDKGSRIDMSRENQLEDNITRSFIITIMNLKKKNLSKFFNNLLKQKLNNLDDLVFDLQNIDEKSNLDLIKNANSKFVLCVSRDKSDINLQSFTKKDKTILEKISKIVEDDKKSEITSILESEYKYYLKHNKFSNSICKLNEVIEEEIKEENIKEIHDMIIQKSRPDAWIFNNAIAILIESKIGKGKIYKTQIFRHISDSNGFNISKSNLLSKRNNVSNLHIINITWEEITKLLENLNLENSFEKYLLQNFKEYLIMNGEIFSLGAIINNKENTFEKRSEQLRYLCKELEKREILKDLKISMNRKKISNHAWQQLGENKENHFSVQISNDSISIELTLRGSIKNKILNKNNEPFFDYLWNNFLEIGFHNEYLSHRYCIYFNEEHIFDSYRGFQSGGNRKNEMFFKFDAGWFSRHRMKEEKILIHLKKLFHILLKKCLQFGIKYEIPYPDLIEFQRRKKTGKPYKRYKNDLETLKNTELLLNEFSEFLRKMQPIYDLLNS